MIEQATLPRPAAGESDEANAKRRQIIEGATQYFWRRASMPPA